MLTPPNPYGVRWRLSKTILNTWSEFAGHDGATPGLASNFPLHYTATPCSQAQSPHRGAPPHGSFQEWRETADRIAPLFCSFPEFDGVRPGYPGQSPRRGVPVLAFSLGSPKRAGRAALLPDSGLEPGKRPPDYPA